MLVWRYRPYLVEGIGIILANVFMGIIAPIIWERKLKPYQRQRLLVFLDPSSDPRASGYHVIQSQVAIGSGGWLGKGFTMGTQKRLAFLPAQHTDFIFSVVGEELGFIGVAVALTLFLVLFMRAIRIATRANDTFSSLRGVRPGGQLGRARRGERRHDAQPHADHGHSRCRSSATVAHSCCLAGWPSGSWSASPARGGEGQTPWQSELPPGTFRGMSWWRKDKKPRRPRRESGVERLEIPADVWEKCEACGHTDLREKFVRNLNVCPACDNHRRIRAQEYADILLDEGSAKEVEADLRSTDPLGFPEYTAAPEEGLRERWRSRRHVRRHRARWATCRSAWV